MDKLLLVFLCLSIVSVINGKDINLARYGKAAQSSVAHGGYASRAIDGNKNAIYYKHSITHTKTQTNPRWAVDLTKQAKINTVNIWNRMDCCSDRLTGAEVYVINGKFSSKQLCRVLGNTKGKAKMVVDCKGKIGNKVMIQIPGKKKILSLAEVEVMGEYIPLPTTPAPAPADNDAYAEKVCKGKCVHLKSSCGTMLGCGGQKFDVSKYCPVTCAAAPADNDAYAEKVCKGKCVHLKNSCGTMLGCGGQKFDVSKYCPVTCAAAPPTVPAIAARSCQIDLVVVMDGSYSQTHKLDKQASSGWKKQVQFAKKLVSGRDSGVRVAFVVYSEKASVASTFLQNQSDLATFLDTIKGDGYVSRMDLGLKTAQETLKGARKEASKKVIILSDGDQTTRRLVASEVNPEPIADALLSSGVQLEFMAVKDYQGAAKHNEMEELADGAENVFVYAKEGDDDKAVESLTKECRKKDTAGQINVDFADDFEDEKNNDNLPNYRIDER